MSIIYHFWIKMVFREKFFKLNFVYFLYYIIVMYKHNNNKRENKEKFLMKKNQT